MATMVINPHTNFDTFGTDLDTEVADQLFQTSQQPNPATNTAEPASVRISEAKNQLAQRNYQFCVEIRVHLGRGKAYHFL